jgi:hypothetical protein
MDVKPLNILDWILLHLDHVDPARIPSISQWKIIYKTATLEWSAPIDHAMIGGFLADRVAYAFAAGYESALRHLVPALPQRAIVSFCVTEEQGAHPSSLHSSLWKNPADDSWYLSGRKKFIPLADEAEYLLVAATTGSTTDGRNIIRIAMIARSTPGVQIASMAALPFVPEISHGTVVLDNAKLSGADILPGDGYQDYIKPFRTIEDLHVLAAIGAFTFRIAGRYRWPEYIKEQILCLLASLHSLAGEDPLAAHLHIALGGIFQQFSWLMENTVKFWEMVDSPIRADWERDKPLLKVAEQARIKRLQKAWARYKHPS